MIKLLGQGGSSNVYLVEHLKLQTYRAIKRIKKDHCFYEQLIQEAHILKSLNHPNIPIIFDIEEDLNYSYIVEEYMEGESLLAYRLSRSVLKEHTIVQFGIQICDVLQVLHSNDKPILYLDLKPENIIISQNALKLIDFGSAVYNDQIANRRCSFGTIGYASPEQYGMQKPDERSDIYAVGMLLYFLITGQSIKEEGCSLVNIDNYFGYSKQLKDIVNQCLKFYKSQRFQNVLQIKNVLLSLQHTLNNGYTGIRTKSLTIAVAGSQTRIGTTHIAILINSYLNQSCCKSLYIEKNNHMLLHTLMERLPKPTTVFGVYHHYHSHFLREAVSIEEVEKENYKNYIYDYGVLSVDNLEDYLLADVKLYVLGAKEWELEHAESGLRLLSKYQNIKYLFNYVTDESFREVLLNMDECDCIRVPYHTDPFDANGNKSITKFMNRVLEDVSLLKVKKMNDVRSKLLRYWKSEKY